MTTKRPKDAATAGPDAVDGDQPAEAEPSSESAGEAGNGNSSSASSATAGSSTPPSPAPAPSPRSRAKKAKPAESDQAASAAVADALVTDPAVSALTAHPAADVGARNMVDGSEDESDDAAANGLARDGQAGSAQVESAQAELDLTSGPDAPDQADQRLVADHPDPGERPGGDRDADRPFSDLPGLAKPAAQPDRAERDVAEPMAWDPTVPEPAVPPAALPPWQRTYAGSGGSPGGTAAADAATPDVDFAVRYESDGSPLAGFGATSATDSFTADAPAQPTAPVAAVPLVGDGPSSTGAWSTARPQARTRPPRQASLELKRIDPWSVLKLALVLAAVGFFVWLVAVGVLYGVLDGMGVWDRLNGTYSDLVSPEQAGGGALISAGRVFGLAAIVGAINSLLFAVAITVGAFVYNVSAEMVGGVELTLSERD